MGIMFKAIWSDGFSSNPLQSNHASVKISFILIGILIDNCLIFIRKFMNTKVDICHALSTQKSLSPMGDTLGKAYSFAQLNSCSAVFLVSQVLPLWKRLNLFVDTFS